MILRLLVLVRALFKGEILLNPETWKNRQVTIEALMAVSLAAMAFFPNLSVTEAQILGLCTAVAAIGDIILTIVTTKKIGLKEEGKVYDYVKAKTDPVVPPTDDPGLHGGDDQGSELQLQSDSSATERAKKLLGG